MFKKIEIWILYLTILFSILLAIGFGFLVRQELVGSSKFGWASKTALVLAEIPANIKKLLKGNDLIQIDRFPNLDGFDGEPNVNEIYLLLSRYDGNLNEGVVELIDLRNFNILHTWNPDIDLFNQSIDQVGEFRDLDRDRNNYRYRLYHPQLTNDGGLLFHDTSPIRKIDACSNLIFQNKKDIFHHSIELDIDGNIWTSTSIYPQTLPQRQVGRKLANDGGYLDDAIVQLSADGKIIFEKSISEIFLENQMEYLLFSVGESSFTADPIHINDVQPVNFDGNFWKKGDVFLSFRHQSMVLLYRPSTNKIIWKGVGSYFHQHDVDIIDSHRISVFNNNSKDFFNGDYVDENNEVTIYDFKTGKYSSYLKKSLQQHNVKSVFEGRSEILPNGDLYIEESNSSRTLYFNADGSLRWTHMNRANDGNVYNVAWSRILYTQPDLEAVNNFLTHQGVCDE